MLKAAIADCEGCGDYVSRDCFASILDSEEDHIDWLETQLDLIERSASRITSSRRCMATPDQPSARARGSRGGGRHAVAIAPAGERACSPLVSSETLLAGASQLAILHNNAVYYLRQTRLGKLILTE